MAAPVYWTADMVRALPDDGNRYEVVWGELLVTPAPRPWHQIVLARLQLALGNHLDRHPTSYLLASPADISWSPDVLVQPDLFVVPREEVSGRWETFKTLLLAVEVVSPSSARGDRLVKRRLYQRQRVATYWVADPDAQLVEVWHPGDDRPEIVTDTLRWQLAPDTDEIAISLRELFENLPVR